MKAAALKHKAPAGAEPMSRADYREIATFEAAISDAQMYEGERTARSWDVTRRLAYATLTRSAAQLRAGVRDEAAAMEFLKLTDQITAFLKWRTCETKLLVAARARILAVCGAEHGEKTAKRRAA